MGAWFAEHWFDLVQTVGIIGSLLFTGYTIREDAEARRIGNSIAIGEQHREIWKDVYSYPELLRIFVPDPNLDEAPVTYREELFVKTLILHLSTSYRALRHGEFVKLDGLRNDTRLFFSLPIPSLIWEKLRPFQDREFVAYVQAQLE